MRVPLPPPLRRAYFIEVTGEMPMLTSKRVVAERGEQVELEDQERLYRSEWKETPLAALEWFETRSKARLTEKMKRRLGKIRSALVGGE